MNTILWFLVIIIIGTYGPDKQSITFTSEEDCRSFREWAQTQDGIYVAGPCKQVKAVKRGETK